MPSLLTSVLMRLRSHISKKNQSSKQNVVVLVKSTHASDPGERLLRCPAVITSFIEFADTTILDTPATSPVIIAHPPSLAVGGPNIPPSVSTDTEITLFSPASMSEIARRTLSFYDQISVFKLLLSKETGSGENHAIEGAAGPTLGPSSSGISKTRSVTSIEKQLEHDLAQLINQMDNVAVKLRKVAVLNTNSEDDANSNQTQPGRPTTVTSCFGDASDVPTAGSSLGNFSTLREGPTGPNKTIESPQPPELDASSFDILFPPSGSSCGGSDDEDVTEA